MGTLNRLDVNPVRLDSQPAAKTAASVAKNTGALRQQPNTPYNNAGVR